MKIQLISGSPRDISVTVRVAKHLYERLSKEEDLEIRYTDLRKVNLPFVQKVWQNIDMVPNEFKPLAEEMFSADAFILVTPEYNGGYSPALKNLLDHFPKYKGKVFALAPASVGVMGGMRCAQNLLLLVPALSGILSPTYLLSGNVDKKFDEEGNLIDSSFQKSIDNFINDFLWLAHKIVK